MGIRKINRATFQALAPTHAIMDEYIGSEVEWFANGAKTILGVIALDPGGTTWNFVVFKKLNKNFQPCKIGWDVSDRDMAKVNLLLAMQESDKPKPSKR